MLISHYLREASSTKLAIYGTICRQRPEVGIRVSRRPWKMHKDGKVYSNNGIFIYECDFEIDPSAQTISAGNDIKVRLTESYSAIL